VDFQARIKDGAVSGGTPPPETGVKVCECCGGTGGGGVRGEGRVTREGSKGVRSGILWTSTAFGSDA
jgi:hypothetical protein